MDHYFSICSAEMYYEKYMAFLLENYDQLRMPYSFPVTLSFLASPVLMEGKAFLCFNDDDEVIGAFSYIYGTGENQYEDKHIVQIQVVYFLEQYRSSRLFLHALQYVTEYIAYMEEDVKEFRFWTSSDDSLRKLFSKIAERIASVETANGPLDEYRASFLAWQSYAAKFQHEPFF
ncbi:N-acetyltransferase domain-containing protein [Brevibacillus sp. IT-7CA2]|uniref:hypothetical protein n=1 Tax=Brevibacillus sp. IT-7CA2 TaxID=3026436 RepID=UPI0039E0325E